MLCERCGKNQATIRLQQNINGSVSEQNLCPSCAAQLGFGGGFMETDMASLVGNLLGNQKTQASTQRCPSCGSSFGDIVATGKAGCSDCYRVFYDEFRPSIVRIHGDVGYKGKLPEGQREQVPEDAADVPEEDSRIDQLKGKLQEAIDAQEYEEAAVLRDEIKRLEVEESHE